MTIRVHDTVSEGSTAWLTVEFLDTAGDPATPSTVTFDVVCATTGATIREAVSISPSSSVLIQLTPTDNEIQDEANAVERRQVIVTATYGASDVHVSVFEYLVRNFTYVPAPVTP